MSAAKTRAAKLRAQKTARLRKAAPDLLDQLVEAVEILQAIRCRQQLPVPLLDCIDSSIAVLHAAGVSL